MCCDNCIRKKHPSQHFNSIYDLVGFLDNACGRDPILCPVDNDDSDMGSTTLAKIWGNLRAGNHLTMRHRALEGWRFECWTTNYQLCTWGSVGVMPDTVLLTLASSVKIKTIDDLLKAVPDWDYASKYGHEALSVLKDADCRHKSESQAQRVKTRQANQKCKLEDLQKDEEQKLLRGFIQPSLYTTPLTSPNTKMINPIVVKHIERPTRLSPSHSQSQPILVSRPYIRTDAFDVLTNGLGYM